MTTIDETQSLLRHLKQVAERLEQPFAWVHIVQGCLIAAHAASPYGREPLLQEVIREIDQRILRFVGKTPGETGIGSAALASIAAGLAAYDAAHPPPPSATVADLLLRWVASGTAEPGDWTLEQVLPILRRFGLREGCFDGSVPWPSKVSGPAAGPTAEPEAPAPTWKERLDDLVGLREIKREVHRLRSFLTVLQERRRRKLPTNRLPLHQVFFGNPGTGKTTIARVLADVYKEFGFLETGQLVETDRSGLVGSVIGETEAKTTEKIHQAMGGVLFIDEAYSLATESQQDFGQRAIDTLVKAMEDHRDRMVVIVAGYEAEMGRFLEANPGLYGRFNRHLRFPDYSDDELIEVFRRLAHKERFAIEGAALARAQAALAVRRTRLGRRFANARDARTLWEMSLQGQASRLCSLPEFLDRLDALTDDLLLQVLPEDVPEHF